MKRKLSGHQLGRIRGRQQALAGKAGQDAEAGDESDGLGPEQTGLVISHYGQQLEVEALEGDRQGERFRCHQRSNLEPLVAGDRVIWRPAEPFGVVVAVLPRRSLLTRPAFQGELRAVAANIDTLLVVIATEPEPFANLIDRYLVAAEHLGLEPVLLLNKCDLLDEVRGAALDALLAVYERVGYRVLRVSSRSGQGLVALRSLLHDRTSIFVGQSGVGKSALVNALLPGTDTQEGRLSTAMAKGRHTTTAARLFHFPEGGDLIDSPGIREFGLSHLEPAQVWQGFAEFRPFLADCRFRDCSHEREPGCRLRAALESGAIDPRRLESCRQILQSLEQDQGPPGGRRIP